MAGCTATVHILKDSGDLKVLWFSCPVSMVLSHSLAPTVPRPAHTARVLTLQTQAASETRSWPHQRLWMKGWALGAGSVK